MQFIQGFNWIAIPFISILKISNIKLAKPRKDRVEIGGDSKTGFDSKAKLDSRDKVDNSKVHGNKVGNDEIAKEKNY